MYLPFGSSSSSIVEVLKRPLIKLYSLWRRLMCEVSCDDSDVANWDAVMRRKVK